MGVKKIARPLNKAKNLFIEWLKENNAEAIEEFEGENSDDGFDYYRCVDAFIGESLYVVYFQMYEGKATIDYKDEGNKHEGMSISEFLELINKQ